MAYKMVIKTHSYQPFINKNKKIKKQMEISITDNKELVFEAIAKSVRAYDSIQDIYNSLCLVLGSNFAICRHLKFVMDDLKDACSIKNYICRNYKFKNTEEQIIALCMWLEEDSNQNNK